MWISYSTTTDAVLIGRKKRTRREWALSHAKKFREGQIIDGYNRNPRNGGIVVVQIKLLRTPYQQSTRRMTMEDYELEGFAWMTEQGRLYAGLEPLVFFHRWREKDIKLWVVDFELIYLTVAGMLRKLELVRLNDEREQTPSMDRLGSIQG